MQWDVSRDSVAESADTLESEASLLDEIVSVCVCVSECFLDARMLVYT